VPYQVKMRLQIDEVIRLFVIPLVGTMLMFVVQPLLFSGQWLRLTDVKVQSWLNNHYMPMAAIVLACTLLSVAIWIGWNVKSPHHDISEGERRATAWWFLSLIPIVGSILAIVLSRQSILAPKGSSDAILPLVVLFTIDIITIYWLTTATSTPANGRRLPPGSAWFKR
jgi:cytochrome bd-type quinol oxidase subunit 2